MENYLLMVNFARIDRYTYLRNYSKQRKYIHSDLEFSKAFDIVLCGKF